MKGSVLVIGAGIAGMQASLDLAESGYKVYLVERQPSIGGNMVKLDKTFPTGDCAMCTISPKMVEVGRSPDIVKLTLSEVVDVKGEPGNFEVTIFKRPKYVIDEKCNGCGDCAEVCPVQFPNDFDAGIKSRKAIDIPFPQAVPLIYALDKQRCIDCKLCEMVCGKGAVDYGQKEEMVKINVGSIIVSTGYELFNPAALEEYGFGRFKNVITNMQFERLLSPSGPTRGHVLRQSDGRAPKAIAFLQCVGSRDERYYPYCSRICCMASTKEAVVAREHDQTLKSYVLYMDMRAFGKGFQEYVNKAEKDYGVVYVRGRVSQIQEDAATGNLTIYYERTEGAKPDTLEVDMVVLAPALKPSAGAEKISKALGIHTDEFGFFRGLADHQPLETVKPGIYINGTCNGPKDIPDAVAEASGAASKAEVLLSRSRNTETFVYEKPPEKEISGTPRIGVFVCHCGTNIAGVVNVKQVVEHVKKLKNVVYAVDLIYMCSQENQKDIREAIDRYNLNRVVVASCTPRNLEQLFRKTCEEAGLNPYLFEMTNIREHCSWAHSNEPEKATDKACDLTRMGISKASLLEPQQKGKANVEGSAVVIGGGIAGMTAALEIAEQGFKVSVIERADRLGGSASEADPVFRHLKERFEANGSISLFLNSTLQKVDGFAGNFRVAFRQGGAENEITGGAIILATGSRELKPHGMHLYGSNRNVMTLREVESRLREGMEYKNVVFIQCVGARDESRPYCSRTCCIEAVRNARMLKERNPNSNVYVLYRDMMTFGFYETDYRDSQAKSGVKYMRFTLENPPKVREENGKLIVSVYDTHTPAEFEIEADKVVLSTPQLPADGMDELQKIMRVPLSADGFFMEAHPKLKPLEFTLGGIYLCGSCQAPKELPLAIAQASGAASRACALISQKVMETEATTAVVSEALCIGCGRCTDMCAFNAISLEKGKAVVNSAACKSCGACASVCPNGAITTRQFTRQQIMAMIDALRSPAPAFGTSAALSED